MYMETDIDVDHDRTFIIGLNGRNDGLNSGEMRWSTEYGSGHLNGGNAMCANSEKLWLVGWAGSNWTYFEHDPISSEDYFRSSLIGGTDGAIARFDIATIFQTDVINQIQDESKLLLYPNPSFGSFKLQADHLHVGESFTIEVFDISGKLILNQSMKYSTSLLLDLSHCGAGQYELRIYTKQTVMSTSFQIYK